MENNTNIFEGAEVIHTYTRAQAIEDGVLVDLMQGEMGNLVREAGFKFHVACTATVFNECIQLTPAAERACNNLNGRLWDILHMLRMAIARGGRGSIIEFQVYVVRKRIRATLTTLKAVCGPGDNGEPVITIMMMDED